tara:strand:+ start:956 stop:1702 length:747 start_codon:yes stop_codon:yes gene_type:complete
VVSRREAADTYRKEKRLLHRDFRCEFYFIRHGESASNATPGFAAGKNFDAPLTPLGVEQARLLGKRFQKGKIVFDRIYSSSLKRAVQTTDTMMDSMQCTHTSFTQVDAIIEQQVPGWRGVPMEEAFAPEPLAYMRGKGIDFVGPDNGESYRMVRRRMATWIENEVIYNNQFIAKYPSARIAIIGHGNATRCLFQYIMGFDSLLIDRIALDNTSISRFIFDSRGWSLVSMNDNSHLMDTGRDPNFDTRP